MKKKILIIHTGGTIAMSENKETGAVTPGDSNPLSHTVTELTGLADITEMQFLNIPSPHMKPKDMFELSRLIKTKLEADNYDGIVLTHGTDTLEETAYFLDLVLDVNEPVVVTGSMRSSNETGYDGPHNLIASVKTAVAGEARGKGVLVVLNDDIHTAENVTKTHTSNVATFQSPQFGPIGIVTKRGVFFHHHPTSRDNYNINKLDKKTTLLKAYAGMEPDLLQAVDHLGYDGLVIEALGQGNLPPELMPELDNLIKKGVPIVIVSRCFNGIVQDIYGYEGGGKQLKSLGVIFSNGLNGQKARLKLMVALEITDDHKKLEDIFLN
ncbi:asparaginase [Scopulibacillus darangshiensis]|uniref:asparaginase n=1 Tax=Scopulibacillus darangshiensis TaxID=442528 RepID=A0A4V6NQR1_9BACL|nr:asparaginase [Scopulibacillus darangshiensis]TCP31666.1 asparaginase [Scopulibacillus darangshiensis]